MISAPTFQEANESICEKLLGWRRHWETPVRWKWDKGDGYIEYLTPAFTNWVSIGLIMDALASRFLYPRIGQREDGLWYCVLRGFDPVAGETCQLAIRAAALEYIKTIA